MALVGGGCGKTSISAGRSIRSASPVPSLRQRTRTVQNRWRPQARGRTTQRASGGCLGDGDLGRLAVGQGHRRAGLDVEVTSSTGPVNGGDDLDVLTLETARRDAATAAARRLRPGAAPGCREGGQRGRAEQQQAGVAGQHRREDDRHADRGQPAQPGRGCQAAHQPAGRPRPGPAPGSAPAGPGPPPAPSGRPGRWPPVPWRAVGHWLALGTGSAARISVTRSSPVTLRTHISGRSTSRCASAGTATALTSSGMT